MTDEQNPNPLHRAARAFEAHPGRLVWAAFLGAVTFFFFGAMFVKILEDARGMELVQRGTWIARSETIGYVPQRDIDAQFLSRTTVLRDYTLNTDVARNYIRRDECKPAAPGLPQPGGSPATNTGEPQPVPVSGASAVTAPKPKASAVDKVFASGLEFAKPACNQRADFVTCSFRVTNRMQESQKLQVELSDISGATRFTYLVDSNGLKYFATDAEVGGVRQYIWHGEKLDPEVPVVASLIFEVKRAPTPPLAISFRVRIQPTSSPNLPDPQSILFKDLSLD
jgi:hypothetical protein